MTLKSCCPRCRKPLKSGRCASFGCGNNGSSVPSHQAIEIQVGGFDTVSSGGSFGSDYSSDSSGGGYDSGSGSDGSGGW